MSSDDDKFDEDRSASIKLSEEGQRRFAAMAESPPKPTEAMKSLQALQSFEVRSGGFVTGRRGLQRAGRGQKTGQRYGRP